MCKVTSAGQGLAADMTDSLALTSLGVLLEDQIRMIRHLSHLHDETKNIGIFKVKSQLLAKFVTEQKRREAGMADALLKPLYQKKKALVAAYSC